MFGPKSACVRARAAHAAVWLAMAAHAATTVTFAFARYGSVHNHTFDLALYARMAWGLVHAQAWDPIVGGNFLGGHLPLVLLPLGALGALFGTVPVLLLAQSVAVALAAWPLCRFAERRLGPEAGAVAAFAWLLQPNLSHVGTYEFHPGTLALLPMCAAFDAFDRERPRAVELLCALTIACRASLGLQTFMLGVLALWLPSMARSGKRIALGSVAYVALWAGVLFPYFGGGATRTLDLHFGVWGGSPLGVLPALVRDPARVLAHFAAPERLSYPLRVLACFGFLPLLRPRFLLVALPPLALNLLSAFPTASAIDSHYLTPALPALAAAAIDGVHALRERLRASWALPACLVLLLAAGAAASMLRGGLPWSRDYDRAAFYADAATASRHRVLARIGPDVSVQAPDPLLPHLAERTRVFRAPPPDRGAEVVVLDIAQRRRFAHREDLLRTIEEPNTRRWLARPDYGAVYVDGDLLMLRHDRSVRTGLGQRYLTGTAPLGSGRAIADCLEVLGAELDGRKLALDLLARAPCPEDLAIRLGAGDKPVRVDLLFDGLLSPAQLTRGDRARSVHALRAAERTAIVRRGLHVGALRSSGARPLPSDPTSVEVPLRVLR